MKEQLRRLLQTNAVEQARTEKMIMGCYVLAADMDETWRLWHTTEAWWPVVEVPITTGNGAAIAQPCLASHLKVTLLLTKDR
jgi:hypothetical protein